MQKPLAIAVNKRSSGYHLSVKQSLFTKQAPEVTAVAIRPVHHRRNAECVIKSHFF
jgi:hypothetical protein